MYLYSLNIKKLNNKKNTTFTYLHDNNNNQYLL